MSAFSGANRLADAVVTGVLRDFKCLIAGMVDATEDEERGVAAVRVILSSDPGTGPVEIRYIGPQDRIADERYLAILFSGQTAFLVDRNKGVTATVPLIAPTGRGADQVDREASPLEATKQSRRGKGSRLCALFDIRLHPMSDWLR